MKFSSEEAGGLLLIQRVTLPFFTKQPVFQAKTRYFSIGHTNRKLIAKMYGEIVDKASHLILRITLSKLLLSGLYLNMSLSVMIRAAGGLKYK